MYRSAWFFYLFLFASHDASSACWVPRRPLLWTSNRDNDAKQWMLWKWLGPVSACLAARWLSGFFGLQGWLRSSAGDGEGLVVVVVVADTEQDVTTIYMWWQSYRCFFSQYSFFHGRFGSALLCYTLTVRCTQNCKCSSSITVFCWRPHNSSSGACQRQSIYLYTTQDFTWRTNFFLWKENHCQLTTWWESVWYQGHGYLWAHSIVSWKRKVLTTEIYSPNSMCGEFKDKLIILFNIIILQHQ